MEDKANLNLEKSLNIGFTGGGTGGHIYPCLAVIEELISQNSEQKIYYIGNSNRLEHELLTQVNLKDYRNISFSQYVQFLGINAEPLIRSVNPLKIVKWFWNFYKQVNLSKKYLQEKNINVIFGTGGYVSGPVFAACKELKIPYIIHNLDAFIGIANAMFLRDAHALTLGLATKQKLKPKNGQVIVTGNPISKKFLSVIASDPANPERSVGVDGERGDPKTTSTISLLITGGSQGAESINNAIGNLLPHLTKLNIQITHITGTKTYENFVAKFLENNPKKYSNYHIEAYTHQMPELCNQADLAICRAGAMTIAEMCVSEVVPIFVPLPWAAHNHQNLNAQTLVDAGAAISLNQADQDFEEQLLRTIVDLIKNPTKVAAMKNQLKTLAKGDAAKAIATLIKQAAHE